MNKVWLVLAMAVIVSGCFTVVAPSPTQRVVNQLENIVAVTTDQGYCSGWIKKNTHEVVTAAHCAEGIDDTATLNVDFGDGKLHPFHIKHKGDPEFTTNPDFMVLYTNDKTIKWPVGFEVCQFKPYYGEEVILMGGPLSFSKSLEYGRVANPSVDLSTIVGKTATYSKHLIEFNGEMWPGNSGGPALDVHYGCVIGGGGLVKLASSDGFGAPVGVNFLSPASDLSKVDL